MKRILMLLISVVIVLGLVMGGWWVYQKFFVETKEFALISNYENIENVPEITLEDLYTGRLERFLNKKYQTGEISSFSELVVPLPKYEINSKTYTNHGFEFVGLMVEEIEKGYYLFTRNYPYKIAAIYKIFFEGVSHYLFIYQWLNFDRSVSFVPTVVPIKFFPNGKPNEELMQILGENTETFLSPVTKIRDVNSCVAIYYSSREFCKWAVRNKLIVENFGGLWNKKSVPQNAVRFPWTFTSSNTSYLKLAPEIE